MKYKLAAAFCLSLILGAAAFFLWPSHQKEEGTAKPTVFNADTAMLAIFGTYDVQRKGVLMPEEFTATWNKKEASELVTPILAQTYVENGVRKGVIAMQRQFLSDGEVVDGHGDDAGISVYVFRFNGTQWVFEKGKKEVIRAGAWGNAPDATLVRLGENKFGFLFKGGFSSQGQTSTYAFFVFLSEQKVFSTLNFDMDADNSGSCSDDPKEQEEDSLEPCWEKKSQLAFLEQPNSPYYVLKLTTTSNEPDDKGKLTPHSTNAFYSASKSGYKLLKGQPTILDKTVPENQIYIDNDLKDGASTAR